MEPNAEAAPEGPSTAWTIARWLLAIAAFLLASAVLLAFRPVGNPGVQACGPSILFLVRGEANVVIHPDAASPERAELAQQPTCRERAQGEVSRAGRFLVGALALAGIGTAVGLVDERLAYRRAPRFEHLLRDLPVEERARHGLVPMVRPSELGRTLPPVEIPEVAGIVVFSLAAAIGLPLLGPWEATMAALGELRPNLIAVAVGAVAVSWIAGGELRRRQAVIAGDRSAGDVFEAVLVTIAAGWLAAVRPVMGRTGVDVHRLRRQGMPAGDAADLVGAFLTASAVVHGSLLVTTVLGLAVGGAPPVTLHIPQLVLIGVAILLVAAGVFRLAGRWRGGPARPSWSGFAHLDGFVPDASSRAELIALLAVTPAAAAVALWACLSAAGVGAPPLVILAIALSGPVAVAISPSPGGAGTVEVLTMLGLVLLGGVHPAPAAAATLAYRVVTYWWPMLAGLVATRRLTEPQAAGAPVTSSDWSAIRNASSSSSDARRR